LQVQRQELRQQLVVRQIRRPSIRGENRFIESLVRVGEPGGPFVVEVGHRAFLELRGALGVFGVARLRFEPESIAIAKVAVMESVEELEARDAVKAMRDVIDAGRFDICSKTHRRDGNANRIDVKPA